MCNFSQGVWDKAMEAGMKAGVEVGRKEGAAQTMLNSIKNVMETLGLTIEQAMSALKVPDADRPKYLELLANSN